jgi:hypothetical protein
MKRSLRKNLKFKRGFERFQKNFGIVVRQLRKKRYLSLVKTPCNRRMNELETDLTPRVSVRFGP